ncbi:MAG: hypothetical protein RLZZ04_3861 [Cyanobacteriota bacterium]|jgi:hypothetical protein
MAIDGGIHQTMRCLKLSEISKQAPELIRVQPLDFASSDEDTIQHQDVATILINLLTSPWMILFPPIRKKC